MAGWWSESKGEFVNISDMNHVHAKNALEKVLRGLYKPRGEGLRDEERELLIRELVARIAEEQQ